jgi:hypothetical protein
MHQNYKRWIPVFDHDNNVPAPEYVASVTSKNPDECISQFENSVPFWDHWLCCADDVKPTLIRTDNKSHFTQIKFRPFLARTHLKILIEVWGRRMRPEDFVYQLLCGEKTAPKCAGHWTCAAWMRMKASPHNLSAGHWNVRDTSESITDAKWGHRCALFVSVDTQNQEIITLEWGTEFSKIDIVDFSSSHNSQYLRTHKGNILFSCCLILMHVLMHRKRPWSTPECIYWLR